MIMELEELKTLWNAYDKKLDKSLQLNLQLLRKLNFEKMASKARTIVIYKIIEIIIWVTMVGYLLNFSIKYFEQPGFSIPAVITIALLVAAIISDIRMLMITTQLQTDYDAPVSSLQKKVHKLKLIILGYVKWSILGLPLYPVFLILAGKIFINVDFWSAKHYTYLMSNIVVGACLLPGFVWLYIRLSKAEITPVWIKNLLIGSGFNQAAAAQQFLDEIDRFEKEEE